MEDVDDLTNNVYLSFAEQYHNIENIENWLRRVLFLSFVKWYKSNKNKKTYELTDRNVKNVTEQNPAIEIDAQAALAALDKLSDEKREIVKLRFWGELKFSEIAEKLNKNEAAVKKMFYRTLVEIKDKLE